MYYCVQHGWPCRWFTFCTVMGVAVMDLAVIVVPRTKHHIEPVNNAPICLEF